MPPKGKSVPSAADTGDDEFKQRSKMVRQYKHNELTGPLYVDIVHPDNLRSLFLSSVSPTRSSADMNELIYTTLSGIKSTDKIRFKDGKRVLGNSNLPIIRIDLIKEFPKLTRCINMVSQLNLRYNSPSLGWLRGGSDTLLNAFIAKLLSENVPESQKDGVRQMFTSKTSENCKSPLHGLRPHYIPCIRTKDAKNDGSHSSFCHCCGGKIGTANQFLQGNIGIDVECDHALHAMLFYLILDYASADEVLNPALLMIYLYKLCNINKSDLDPLRYIYYYCGVFPGPPGSEKISDHKDVIEVICKSYLVHLLLETNIENHLKNDTEIKRAWLILVGLNEDNDLFKDHVTASLHQIYDLKGAIVGAATDPYNRFSTLNDTDKAALKVFEDVHKKYKELQPPEILKMINDADAFLTTEQLKDVAAAVDLTDFQLAAAVAADAAAAATAKVHGIR